MNFDKKTKTIAKNQRRGFSLLEFVAAATLMISILVPSISVMRDAMANSRDMNHRNVLSLYSDYFMELFVGVASNNWILASNFNVVLPVVAPDGYGNIRVVITMSDNPLNGGIAGLLSHVQVTTFDDVNLNAVLDANEPNVKYRTKVARLNTYENEEK